MKEVEDRSITEINENKEDLPVLLVIDDNPEIRKILISIFKNTFNVLEAEDGEKGLKTAQKEIPDCIISDVMMPNMDGFLFTKAIKENEITSFIPVVLLTAKTSDEAHLEGLKSTADAFLTKPFNHNILQETVSQLLQERKRLRQRYSKELILKPLDVVINSTDEKFLDKLQHLINEQLSNPDFSADDFANKMGMGKMQLYRKLKSLIGLSATEYLRSERLKAAATLLKKGNGNISEIAYSVGFNDLSYFSKCFKEMYHYSPSEFIKKV
jgi:YesN/AraC family two-component response regulator